MGEPHHTNKLGDVGLIQTRGTDGEPGDECSQQSTTQRRGPQNPVPACEGRGGRRTFALRRSTESLVNLAPRVGYIVQAPISVLLEATTQEIKNFRRSGKGQRLPVRIATENRGNRVRDRLCRKCLPARQGLVQHAAKRPDVCSFVEWLTARLLRTHVGRRSQNHARLGGSDAQRGGVGFV